MTNDHLLITTEEFAAILRCTKQTIFNRHASGTIPSPVRTRAGKRGRHLWLRAEVLAWIEMGCPSRAEFEERRRGAPPQGCAVKT